MSSNSSDGKDTGVKPPTHPDSTAAKTTPEPTTPPPSESSKAVSSSSTPVGSTKHLTITNRALRAGGAIGAQSGSHSIVSRPISRMGLSSGDRYLVVGEGITAPFMALCLRMNGLECDLLQTNVVADQDRGTIVLTPGMTQILGDLLGVSVPSGSVVGRLLTFDHVGNDMCDLDLNEFREKGESPTFYSCDRTRIQQALLSLCRLSQYACTLVPPNSIIDHRTVEAQPNGNVTLRFLNNPGVTWEYKKIIVTSRNHDYVPDASSTADEMRHRSENEHVRKEAKNYRWLEVNVPPLPPLGQYEKRFTPGSQEIVEIVTPRENKMIIRPTLMATKLFYNVLLTLPEIVGDPRKSTYNAVHFWGELSEAWTGGVPGYIAHTLFKPMIEHIQHHAAPRHFLVYKSPQYMLPYWTQLDGRILRIGTASYDTCTDAIDVTDAHSFVDCFKLAETLARGPDGAAKWLQDVRRLEVMEAMDQHNALLKYTMKERGQVGYAMSRFGMKFMRRYKSTWRKILTNLKTMI